MVRVFDPVAGVQETSISPAPLPVRAERRVARLSSAWAGTGILVGVTVGDTVGVLVGVTVGVLVGVLVGVGVLAGVGVGVLVGVGVGMVPPEVAVCHH